MAIAISLLTASFAASAQENSDTRTSQADGGSLETVHVIGTAEEELLQAPGVSIITSEQIARRPPVNDLSEIIRTMPGVNLTGNSTSGQRGNNRQIDIRGMGPENTLILIDGRPATSRNSIRYGWRGERDTRGDTNWVPPQEVERIEVLRGPAAARYGNGAAGGVVNIITRRNTEQLHGSATVFLNQPVHSDDGQTQRVSFNLSGPIGSEERFSFRLFGNVSKTDADSFYINQGHTTLRTGTYANTFPAGREGVRNRDIGGRLSWNIVPGHTLDLDASFSRQGNIYTGDTQNTNTNKLVTSMLGMETNRLYRRNIALTYNGEYDFGTTQAYIQHTNTRNTRYNEGLAGGTEGIFDTNNMGFSTNELDDYVAHIEADMPMVTAGFSHVLTIGATWTRSELNDPNSVKQTFMGGPIPGLSGSGRSSQASANIQSLFIEDNLGLTDSIILTPGIRFDHHSISGSNWSPSLNLSYFITDTFTIKAGIASAYKAPNLYQSNENYVLYSRGQGCWGSGTNGCYLVGNANLKPETSINKEIGFEYRTANNFLLGATYFRNDYRNKIESGTNSLGTTTSGTLTTDIFQWENVPRAVVQGIEGTVNIPLNSSLNWGTNFTYMITSENKSTGDILSVTPRYTVNSTLDWQINPQWDIQATLTYFGRQRAKRFDYRGNPVTGSDATARGSYGLLGLSSTYRVNNNLQITAGVSNLFDKRLYRRGNASGVGYGTVNMISGAGAETYNQPGRAFYISLTQSF